MALIVNDRVKETSTTTGTGTLNLAGAEQLVTKLLFQELELVIQLTMQLN
jgi:hypothetical protein